MIYYCKDFFAAEAVSIKSSSLLILLTLFLLLFCGKSSARDFSWGPGETHRSINNFDEKRFLPTQKEPLPKTPAPPALIEKKLTGSADRASIRERNRQIAQLKKKLSQVSDQSAREIKQLQLEVSRLNNALDSAQARQKNLLFGLFPTAVWPASGLISSHDIFSAALSVISPLSGAITGSALPTRNLQPDALSRHNVLTPLADEMKADYAAGILIGRNIMQMNKRNSALNIKTDNQTVLSGIQDFLEQRSRLSEEEVNDVLFTVGSTLQEATEAFSSRHQLAGAAFVEKFIKRAGTHRAPAGFYYKIEQKSRGVVAPSDKITIRIRESLVDGTVVSDSGRSGSVISQQLNAYPPLFQDAIYLAGQKGAITLVVPPELAYGEEGNPPLIPPAATMIYYLEVIDTTS